MTDNGIIIHAEMLAFLTFLSISVQLPSPSTPSTTAEITERCRLLTITHGDAKQKLELPALAIPDSKCLPVAQGMTSLSFRLPMGSGIVPDIPQNHDAPVPWTAADIWGGSAVRCRGCDQDVVSPSTAQRWKNLPSENWAEMMEYWHCHKPYEPKVYDKAGDDNVTTKAYGANNAISAQQRVGFVDLVSFMFHKNDCANLEYQFPSTGNDTQTNSGKDTKPSTSPVFCATCKRELGYVGGPSDSSVSLLKWQVKPLNTHGGYPPPLVTELLSAALLATALRSGTTKSLVMPRHPGDGQEPAPVLYIWTLNNYVTYSNTLHPVRRQLRNPACSTALKVAYRVVTRQEADEMLASMSSGVQEVNFPQAAIVECLEELQKTNSWLPEAERRFKEFDIGFLKRWVRWD